MEVQVSLLEAPVQISNVVEPGRMSLTPASREGEYEIVDTRTGQVQGMLYHDKTSPNQVELYHGKGGLCAVITSAQGVRYFGLCGSMMQVGGTRVELYGEHCATNPDKQRRTPGKTDPQQITTQAMILGAGLATRFEPISGDRTQHSKPAVYLLGEQTVIGAIADTLTSHGFSDLFVNTYFKPESLKAMLSNSTAKNITYIDEAEPSGTAGGLRKLLTDSRFAGKLDTSRALIVIQGDSVTDADLSALMEAHARNNALITIGCQPVADKDVDKFGIIVTDKSGGDEHSGEITGFQEKPKLEEAQSRLGNTGFYVIAPSAYPVIREIYEELLAKARAEAQAAGKPQPDDILFDFANDVFPNVLKRVQSGQVRGKFWAQAVEGYWSDIGNPVQYLESVHDVYAGKTAFPIPDNAGEYYRDGILYWPGAQLIADSEGAQLKGNVVVAKPYQA